MANKQQSQQQRAQQHPSNNQEQIENQQQQQTQPIPQQQHPQPQQTQPQQQHQPLQQHHQQQPTSQHKHHMPAHIPPYQPAPVPYLYQQYPAYHQQGYYHDYNPNMIHTTYSQPINLPATSTTLPQQNKIVPPVSVHSNGGQGNITTSSKPAKPPKSKSAKKAILKDPSTGEPIDWETFTPAQPQQAPATKAARELLLHVSATADKNSNLEEVKTNQESKQAEQDAPKTNASVPVVEDAKQKEHATKTNGPTQVDTNKKVDGNKIAGESNKLDGGNKDGNKEGGNKAVDNNTITNGKDKPIVEENNVTDKIDNAIHVDASIKKGEVVSKDDDKSVENTETANKSNDSDAADAADSANPIKADDSSKPSDEDQSLTYDDSEQYNPVTNPNGKRKYSKRFLLEVCEKVCKVKFDRQEKTARGESRHGPMLSEKVDYFAVPFGSNQKYSNRQSQDPNRTNSAQDKPRRILTLPTPPEVELKTASNPWRPAKEADAKVPQDELEIQILKKKFRGILNKLTPQNFDSLAKLVIELTIDTESKLEQVIDIVFAKALAEPEFCELYGSMCSLLKKKTIETIGSDKANFGNTLLKRCQNQFIADVYAGLNVDERQLAVDKEENPEIKKQLEEELYEDMWKCRKRNLGLIKFIGELYKIDMLNKDIMFDCIYRLLNDQAFPEESIECLCDLLATIGEKLDKSSNTKESDKDKKPAKIPKAKSGQIAYAQAAAQAPSQKVVEPPRVVLGIDSVFDCLHKLIDNKENKLSSRIRYKLMDTCDLREKLKWRKRGVIINLQKIDEIHKEAQEKKNAKRLEGRKILTSNQKDNAISDQNDLEKEHASNKEKLKSCKLITGFSDEVFSNAASLRPCYNKSFSRQGTGLTGGEKN